MRPFKFYLPLVLLSAGCSAADPSGTSADPERLTGRSSEAISNPNSAESFAYGGFVTTNLAFSEFFGANFTMTAWVLPQYVYNNPGTVFTDAAGNFSVGQGDYRSGNGADGRAGDPVLSVKVGTRVANYLAPGYAKLNWNSLAVMRTVRTGKTMFLLFLNGVQLTPFVKAADGTISDTENISFAAGETVPTPSGTLLMGRRTAAQNSANQLYGLVDEVAVINRALTLPALQTRLQTAPTGNETDLVAGWVFDSPVSVALPPKLARPLTRTGATGTLAVVGHTFLGSALVDSLNLFLPAQMAKGVVGTHQLPFTAGEVWKVVQGNDDPGGSHNGQTAAFSYDFSRDPNPVGALDRTSLGGTITNVINLPEPTDGSREGSSVTVQIAPHVFNVYLHNTTDSFVSTFLGPQPPDSLVFLPTPSQPAFWLPVGTGAAIATVGPNAKHEHYNARDDAMSIPTSFSNYFESSDKVNWSFVSVGRPTKGTWVKR